jgi:hypothetical protein
MGHPSDAAQRASAAAQQAELANKQRHTRASHTDAAPGGGQGARGSKATNADTLRVARGEPRDPASAPGRNDASSHSPSERPRRATNTDARAAAKEQAARTSKDYSATQLDGTSKEGWHNTGAQWKNERRLHTRAANRDATATANAKLPEQKQIKTITGRGGRDVQYHHHAGVKESRAAGLNPDIAGERSRMSALDSRTDPANPSTIGKETDWQKNKALTPHNVAAHIDEAEQDRTARAMEERQLPANPDNRRRALVDASATSKSRLPAIADRAERAGYDWSRRETPAGRPVNERGEVIGSSNAGWTDKAEAARKLAPPPPLESNPLTGKPKDANRDLSAAPQDRQRSPAAPIRAREALGPAAVLVGSLAFKALNDVGSAIQDQKKQAEYKQTLAQAQEFLKAHPESGASVWIASTTPWKDENSLNQPGPRFHGVTVTYEREPSPRKPSELFDAGSTGVKHERVWIPPATARPERPPDPADTKRSLEKTAQSLEHLQTRLSTFVSEGSIDRAWKDRIGTLDPHKLDPARAHLASAGIALEQGRTADASESIYHARELLRDARRDMKRYQGAPPDQ